MYGLSSFCLPFTTTKKMLEHIKLEYDFSGYDGIEKQNSINMYFFSHARIHDAHAHNQH